MRKRNNLNADLGGSRHRRVAKWQTRKADLVSLPDVGFNSSPTFEDFLEIEAEPKLFRRCSKFLDLHHTRNFIVDINSNNIKCGFKSLSVNS
jgi:hypothetical protein